MDKDLFDDLIASCKEVIEYQKGNIELKTQTITIPDDDIDMEQIIFLQLGKLSHENKQKVMQYTNELLQASNG
jgi:hypothetical protein